MLYIFLRGVPVLRYFLVIGLVGGLAVGLLRYFRRSRQRSAEIIDIEAKNKDSR